MPVHTCDNAHHFTCNGDGCGEQNEQNSEIDDKEAIKDDAAPLFLLSSSYWDPISWLGATALTECFKDWKHRNISCQYYDAKLGYHNRYANVTKNTFHKVWMSLFEHLNRCVTSRVGVLVDKLDEFTLIALQRTQADHVYNFLKIYATTHALTLITRIRDCLKEIFLNNNDETYLKESVRKIMRIWSPTIDPKIVSIVSYEVTTTLKTIFDRHLSEYTHNSK